MKFRNLIFITLLLMGQGVLAEDESSELTENMALADYDSILDSIEEAVEERTTTGTIEAIDLAGRTAIIGGYMYHFGPSTESTPLKVRILDRDYGSLGMLSVGMDVEVIYFQGPAGDRVGNELTQIESAEKH